MIIAASAQDNIGVVKVKFFVSNQLTCTDTTIPYECAWRVPAAANKTYQLQAKAYDAAGNIGTSPLITVTAR